MKGIEYYLIEIRKELVLKYPHLVEGFDDVIKKEENNKYVFLWIFEKSKLYEFSNKLNQLITDFWWELY